MGDGVGEKKWWEDFSTEENDQHSESLDEEVTTEEELQAVDDRGLVGDEAFAVEDGASEDDDGALEDEDGALEGEGEALEGDDKALEDEGEALEDDDEALEDEDEALEENCECSEDDGECPEQEVDTPDRKKHLFKEIKEWASSFAIAIAIAAVIMFFFAPVIIFKQSMEPNFHSDDRVFASRRAYSILGSPKRGDVIVFKSGFYENGKELNYIKRVIGLPGETIAIKSGIVYINGEEIDEPYLEAQGISGEMEEMTIEEGRLFVMGDNRTYSKDSRNSSVGTIEISKVIGKVVFRFYPLDSMKFF